MAQVGALVLLAAGFAAAAPAQEPPAPGPPLDLSTQATPRQCDKATSGEVVVCGERERSPYRIDPATLDSMRAEDAIKNPDRVASRDLPATPCGVGNDICGGDAIPLLQPALKVAEAVVKAVNGEDWREPFRTGVDEYQLYEDAKRKQDSASVTVGVSASSGP